MALSAVGGGRAAVCRLTRPSSSLYSSLPPRFPSSTTLHLHSCFAPAFAAYSSLSFRQSSRPLLHFSLSPLSSPFPTSPSSPNPSPFSRSPFFLPVRHATKKAGGSTKNSPGSAGKRLGLKESGGSVVHTGCILVRQRGFEVHAGRGVGTGRDHTLFSTRTGRVVFTYLQRPYRRSGKRRKFINVLDTERGETMEELQAELAQLQADYLEVLRRKKQGIHIPTTRSVYLAGVAQQRREKARIELEQQIERVSAQQLTAVPEQTA